MAWALISDDFHGDPRIIKLQFDPSGQGIAALGLWTVCLAWTSKYCTKVVPRELLQRFNADEALADALVRAELWTVNDDGWAFVPDDDLYRHSKRRKPPSTRQRVGWYISKERRQRILERDDFRCVSCGSTEDLTLDHKVPRSRGGGHSDSNLQTMCRPCNSRKGARI